MKKRSLPGLLLTGWLITLPLVATAAPVQERMLFQEMAKPQNSNPKALPPSAIAAEITHVQTFLVGHQGPELTAFMDPNCIWCHRFYEKALPILGAGKLRLRVVLVGFLKPSSPAKTASILMSNNPAKALAYDESHFNTQKEEGGIRPAINPPPLIRRAVRNNNRLLIRTGEEATPTLLYRNKQMQWELQHGLGSHGLHKIMENIS
ncbi:thioredoxin fold domain-containing protein [Acidithiobacillus ferrooxidans]|uniref:thioredoxin fold domain-containing protein n=1 Tax=Acidithiobacillus ferrooxidans TaxID=920 RepID=UPI001C073ECE|nr:thioredoxin fold domain-containing protein [Acidithiobacillus ferrooxidans]MBU2857907.1 thioredoxin fold domain-containing protein [Acidithiobacillus ferrooxidans]